MTHRRKCEVCGSPTRRVPSDLPEEKGLVYYDKCTAPRCNWIGQGVARLTRRVDMQSVQLTLPDSNE